MRKRDLRKLRRVVDGSDNLMMGHRVVKEDVFFNRTCPEWAKHDTQVRGLLLRVFPKLASDATQRKRAAKWMRVITLYFREGRSCSYVAETMGLTEKNVEMTIYRITRRAAGLSSDSCYEPTGRPGGRPKKVKFTP